MMKITNADLYTRAKKAVRLPWMLVAEGLVVFEKNKRHVRIRKNEENVNKDLSTRLLEETPCVVVEAHDGQRPYKTYVYDIKSLRNAIVTACERAGFTSMDDKSLFEL